MDRYRLHFNLSDDIIHRVALDTASGNDEEVRTANGVAGANGADGHGETKTAGPGPGENGQTGGNSDEADAGGGLVFKRANPFGSWYASAESGFGGNGGNGGNAGAFIAISHADHGPWPSGGDGGNGGASGNVHVNISHRNIFGLTGADTGDGIYIGEGGGTNNGGAGGNGGNGDGETGPVHEPGGSGGNGGAGGASGNVTADFSNNVIRATTNTADPTHFNIVVSVGAFSIDGGPGGDGGLAGAGVPDGADGLGGNGGQGGYGQVNIIDDTFHMAVARGGSSSLVIAANAGGGYGGLPGSTMGNEFENVGRGGDGGNATIMMHGVQIIGGAEDDVVSLSFYAKAGLGGFAFDGTPGNDGNASIDFANNTLDGGGGHNTLGFSGSYAAVFIDLATHVLYAGTDPETVTNTVKNFQDIGGGNFDDTLIGDGKHNVIDGSLGADQLYGGGGGDTFAYDEVSDSTGARFDTIHNGNFDADHFRLPSGIHVAHTDHAMKHVSLNAATFDTDMATAVNAHHLHAHSAVLVSAKVVGGEDAGPHLFLVIDGNGQAGYQAGGNDFVIDVTGASGTLTTGFFD